MSEERICLVTAFTDIGREKWTNGYKRSVDDYINGFLPYLKFNEELIVFTSQHIIKKISESTLATKNNLKFVPFSFCSDGFRSLGYLATEEKIMQSAEYKKLILHRIHHPEHSEPLYNIVQHLKVDFVRHVIDNSLTSAKYIAWTDFGFFHNNESKIPDTKAGLDVLDLNKFDLHKINYCTINDLIPSDHTDIYQELRNAPEIIAGSFFLGSQDKLKDYSELYHTILNLQFYDKNIVDDDQHVVLRCCIMVPNMFKLWKTGWHNTYLQFQLDGSVIENEDYGFLPIKQQSLIKFYYEQRNVRWVPTDINLKDERDDYDKCDTGVKTFIEGIFAFLIPSDGLVNKNLFTNFQVDTSFYKEAGAFYSEQASMETVHGEMYSLLAQTMIRDPTKLNHIFNSIQTYSSVKNIKLFMEKYMDRTFSLGERIIAFACVEGILFTSVFAAIYWLKKRNILRGFCKANEFIARDEGIHTKFAVALYLLAASENRFSIPHKSSIMDIIREAVACGSEFIKEILKAEYIGMNSDDLISYTKCTADTLSVSVGCDKIYNVENPFDWMAVISLPNKTNFFEDTVSEYTQDSGIDFVFDENTDF